MTYIEKLSESGISENVAKQNDLSYDKSYNAVGAIKFNYYHTDGTPMKMVNGECFVRYRHLATKEILKDRDLSRYTQPSGSRPYPYFPPMLKWSDIIKEPKTPIIITEGELKAIKACAEGFPTISLAGVSSFQSKRHGMSILPELDKINYVNRKVYITYDNDLLSNTQVCNAMVQLMEVLSLRGAMCYIVILPQLPDLEKVGLDDFLIRSSAEEFQAVLDKSKHFNMVKIFFELNEKYCYVREINAIVELKSFVKYDESHFKTLGTTNSYIYDIEDDGKIITKLVNPHKYWMQWPMRNQVDKISYEPNKESYYDNTLNVWRKSDIEPYDGDVDLFIDLLNVISNNRIERQYLINWLAYPLQNMGKKMTVATLLQGKQGTGKSTLGEIMCKIYGDYNSATVQKHQLDSGFNSWAKNKQFVVCEETTTSFKKADADFLKNLITQKTIAINEKFTKEYELRDCINYLFTTNHYNAVSLDNDDRRWFIIESKNEKASTDFYNKLHKWLDEDYGYGKILNFLLSQDLEYFNPYTSPIATEGKTNMIKDGRNDVESFIDDFIENQEIILSLRCGGVYKGLRLFSSKILMTIYLDDGLNQKNIRSNSFRFALKRKGYQPMAITTKEFGKDDFFVIGDKFENWVNKSQEEIEKHFKETKGGSGGGNF